MILYGYFIEDGPVVSRRGHDGVGETDRASPGEDPNHAISRMSDLFPLTAYTGVMPCFQTVGASKYQRFFSGGIPPLRFREEEKQK